MTAAPGLTLVDVHHGSPRYRVATVDGWHVDVVAQLFNWRIMHVDAAEDPATAWGQRYWCYTGLDTAGFLAAVLAAQAWDGKADTEPVGWVKAWDGRRHGEPDLA